jgi:hypothetical protein
MLTAASIRVDMLLEKGLELHSQVSSVTQCGPFGRLWSSPARVEPTKGRAMFHVSGTYSRLSLYRMPRFTAFLSVIANNP